MRAIVVSLALAACVRVDPPAKRVAIPRHEVTRELQPDLPHRGVVWNRGGLGANGPVTNQIVLDVDANTLAITVPQAASPTRQPLPTAEAKRLWDQAAIVWAAPKPPTDDVTDYVEYLVLVDGDDAYELAARGPIHASLAATLISNLQVTQQSVRPR